MSSSATTTVRIATRADAERAGDILRLGYQGMDPGPYLDYVVDPTQWMDEATATLVAVRGEPTGGDEQAGGDVVGVVAFALADSALHEPVVPPMGDASFRFLAVDPDARGHGIGRALVQACIRRARDGQARRLAIFTMDFMEAAQRLYPRLGFTRRPDLDVRFPGGRGLALVKDLTPDAADHFAPPRPAPSEPPWYEAVFDDGTATVDA